MSLLIAREGRTARWRVFNQRIYYPRGIDWLHGRYLREREHCFQLARIWRRYGPWFILMWCLPYFRWVIERDVYLNCEIRHFGWLPSTAVERIPWWAYPRKHMLAWFRAQLGEYAP